LNAVQRRFEWGVMPAPSVRPQTKETLDGTFGTICFRFEAETGELLGVEVPGNLLAEHSRMEGVAPLRAIAETGSVAVFVDVEFWSGAARPRERSFVMPTTVRVGTHQLTVEFSDGPYEWVPLSPEVAVALSPQKRLSGISCTSSRVDFLGLARST
jgi:hypothetical protein